MVENARVEDPDGVTSYWFGPGPNPSDGAIWVVSQWLKDSPFSVSDSSSLSSTLLFKQINI